MQRVFTVWAIAVLLNLGDVLFVIIIERHGDGFYGFLRCPHRLDLPAVTWEHAVADVLDPAPSVPMLGECLVYVVIRAGIDRVEFKIMSFDLSC
jgi:hypothetical protein